MLKEVAPALPVPASTPIPAGWYPDPAGSFQQRWWNGSAWTNDFAQYRPTLIHSAPLPEAIQAGSLAPSNSAAFAAQQATATADDIGSAAVHHAAANTSTLTHEAKPQPPESNDAPLTFGLPPADRAPLTSVSRPNAGNAVLVPVTPITPEPAIAETNSAWANYTPFEPAPQSRRGARSQPERRYTVAVWILALLPGVFFGIAVVIAQYFPTAYTVVTQAILAVAFLLVGVGIAALDQRALARHGYTDTASAAWGLLAPLSYLSVRAVTVARESGRGAFAPLFVMLAVLVAIALSLVLVSGLVALLTANPLY
jgi:hypothetical protein